MFMATPPARSPTHTRAMIARMTANAVGPCQPLIFPLTPSRPRNSEPGPLYPYQTLKNDQMKYTPAPPRMSLSAGLTLDMSNEGFWAMRAPFEGLPSFPGTPRHGD